jgi:hypothetical protein
VTPRNAASAAPIGPRALARHDRVRVPDGRIGEVIGFYREDDEPMLILFGTGDSRRYCRADLRLVA